MVYTAIKKLVQYGLETGLITETDLSLIHISEPTRH